MCAIGANTLVLLILTWLTISVTADTTIIVLTVAQSDLVTSNTSSSAAAANFTSDHNNESIGEYYLSLSDALESVMRLAADDINSGASILEDDLKLAIVGVNSGVQAMEGFCKALEAVGDNGTFGVSRHVCLKMAKYLYV